MGMVGVAAMEKVDKVDPSNTLENSLGTTAVAVGCPSETVRYYTYQYHSIKHFSIESRW